MLAAGGRASPFGDLADGATAAGAGSGTTGRVNDWFSL